MNVVIANIIGVIVLIISTISWWKKTKEKILKLQITSNAIAIIQYILLIQYGGFSGILIKIIAICRDIINIKKENNKFLQSKNIIIIFLAIYFVIGVVTYNNIISIFSVLAVVSYTILIWQDNVKSVRMAAVVSTVFGLYIIYV